MSTIPRPNVATWPALVIALVAIVATAPHLGAFTSQVVGLTARVVDKPLIRKDVLRAPNITQEEVDAITASSTGVTGCLQADADPPIEVPTHTCVWWVLRITVNNLTGSPMAELMVVDRFGAELDGHPLSDVPVEVFVISHSRGHSGRDHFETQVRITWCVTQTTVVAFGECSGPDTPLQPGESAFLDVLVFTKLNPSGKQEYTSAGTYEMNSGAVAKWRDGDGTQRSASTPPIMVEASDSDADGDGFAAASDCNDADPGVHPTAAEIPGNGRDDDCNPGTLDEVTPTPAATETATPTATAEPPVEDEPTAAPTEDTATLSPTLAPTDTPTSTASSTPTETATPTPTLTATATATPEGG